MRTQPAYLERIRKKYNGIGEDWDKTDRWHAWNKRQIEEEMLLVSRQFAPRSTSQTSKIQKPREKFPVVLAGREPKNPRPFRDSNLTSLNGGDIPVSTFPCRPSAVQ